jgi:hypothetical protein
LAPATRPKKVTVAKDRALTDIFFSLKLQLFG